jgi:hypothetical protein
MQFCGTADCKSALRPAGSEYVTKFATGSTKPNSTENSAKLETGAQDPGKERITPQIPRFGRFPPSATLRFIQEAAGMTSRRETEGQQNHGRTESYGPALYGPASNNPGFAPHDSVRS